MDSATNLEKATLYERYRLPYAANIVDDLLGQIGQVQTVADIGAGTGQLARLFAPRSSRAYAVEPDSAMRQIASAVLATWPTVEVVAATAEQTTLADNSVDLIVVGNAFQRFKPEACDEFRRILKRRGWVALITYTFANQAFTDMLFSKLAALNSVTDKIEQRWHHMPMERLFGAGEIQQRRYHQSANEDWTAFFGAACSGIEAPTRADDDFAQFEALNREVFDAFASAGRIQIEYETRVSFGQLQ